MVLEHLFALKVLDLGGRLRHYSPLLMGRRSVRRVAISDQIVALFCDTNRLFSTVEVACAVGVFYSEAYSVLTRLIKEQRIQRVEHPELRHLLWGGLEASFEPVHQLALERGYRAELEHRMELAVRLMSAGDIEAALETLRLP